MAVALSHKTHPDSEGSSQEWFGRKRLNESKPTRRFQARVPWCTQDICSSSVCCRLLTRALERIRDRCCKQEAAKGRKLAILTMRSFSVSRLMHMAHSSIFTRLGCDNCRCTLISRTLVSGKPSRSSSCGMTNCVGFNSESKFCSFVFYRPVPSTTVRHCSGTSDSLSETVHCRPYHVPAVLTQRRHKVTGFNRLCIQCPSPRAIPIQRQESKFCSAHFKVHTIFSTFTATACPMALWRQACTSP